MNKNIEFARKKGSKDKKKRRRKLPLGHRVYDPVGKVTNKGYNAIEKRFESKKRIRSGRLNDLGSTVLGAATFGTIGAILNKRAGRHHLSGAFWTGAAGAFAGSNANTILERDRTKRFRR